MIVPWVGTLPDWIGNWCANTEQIRASGHGWDFLLDLDERRFKQRVKALGVKCPVLEGRKLCDYRPAFGEMYADEVADFDFWGHTDLDCAYGSIWDFVTDEMLANVDIFSNDPYPQLCGPFSLYRTDTASHVFRDAPGWQQIFEDPELHAFDETGIAPTIAASDLRVLHKHYEGEGSLLVHFTSSKTYPEELAGLVLP